MRLVLYVPSALRDQIQADARRRGEVAGLEVSLNDAAKALLRQALAGEGADPPAAASVVADLTTCARKLRERGALTAAGAASLASALEELAGRLGAPYPITPVDAPEEERDLPHRVIERGQGARPISAETPARSAARGIEP